jgi:hypothetical protein
VNSTIFATEPAARPARWPCEAPGCGRDAAVAYATSRRRPAWRRSDDAASAARVCSAACLPAALAVRHPLIPVPVG